MFDRGKQALQTFGIDYKGLSAAALVVEPANSPARILKAC
jgi:hypothetical protein